MKLAGALVLLGAALLLTSGGDCGICPVIEKDLDLFFHGTEEDYIAYVEEYNSLPVIVEAARNIKKCVDSEFTEEDKAQTTAFVEKINSNKRC